MSDTANPNPPAEAPPILRWRETTQSEPSGFAGVVHTLTRVVEGLGPIPKGAKATTDDVCDWTIQGGR